MLDVKISKETLFKVINTYKYLIIIVAVGLIILMLPSSNDDEKEASEKKIDALFDIETFENRIENILKNGEGIGRVNVVLTIKSGMEYVYAEETKLNTREQMESGDRSDINKDSDKRPSILSNSDGGEEPVVVKTIYPEFLGAAVVCDGADNPKVQMYITDVISSLTGVTSDRITIIKMKN